MGGPPKNHTGISIAPRVWWRQNQETTESVQNQEANWGEKAEQETRKGGESGLGDRAIKRRDVLKYECIDLILRVSHYSDMPLLLLSPPHCSASAVFHIFERSWNSNAPNRKSTSLPKCICSTKIVTRGIFSQWQKSSGTSEHLCCLKQALPAEAEQGDALSFSFDARVANKYPYPLHVMWFLHTCGFS